MKFGGFSDFWGLKKKIASELLDSGDCTTVATQPRQLHYSNNLSNKTKKERRKERRGHLRSAELSQGQFQYHQNCCVLYLKYGRRWMRSTNSKQ